MLCNSINSVTISRSIIHHDWCNLMRISTVTFTTIFKSPGLSQLTHIVTVYLGQGREALTSFILSKMLPVYLKNNNDSFLFVKITYCNEGVRSKRAFFVFRPSTQGQKGLSDINNFLTPFSCEAQF